MESSPYASRPPESFWRSAVAQRPPGAPVDLYRPRFQIGREHRIAVAGDCFAWQFARALRTTAATVLDCEPPPSGLSDRLATRYGYNAFSARHGNIYFARQLRQLIEEVHGRHEPADVIWERDGRYYDALRPSVEPGGLESPAEVAAHRCRHLVAVRKLLESMDIFVYVFSLNEGWLHTASGTVYPTAPSTIAGSYDPAVHDFHTFTYDEVYEDFKAAVTMLREANPTIRIVTLVSPVPGTATITDMHILTADTEHTAIQRAIAGTIAKELDFVEYFPAFELVGTPFSNRRFYEPNRRTVSSEGLSAVLKLFLSQHRGLECEVAQQQVSDDDQACEDALLAAFAP